MAFAQPRRANRHLVGNSVSQVSPRKKHQLTPKERAIVEAQKRREARERETGWNARFSIPEPHENWRGGNIADMYAKPKPRRRQRSASRNAARTPGAPRQTHHSGPSYRGAQLGSPPRVNGGRRANARKKKAPPNRNLRPLRKSERPDLPNLMGGADPTAAQRQLAQLQVDAVRAVGYRESLLMQLNAVVLNWPRDVDHPTRMTNMPSADRLRVKRLSFSAMPQAARMLKNLAVELREAGLRCVEKIVAWVLASNPNASEPAPFFWNGQDYLLKMFSDLDFVEDSIGPESRKIGNFAKGNPLLLSVDELSGRGARAALGRAHAAAVVIADVVRRHMAREREEESMKRHEQQEQSRNSSPGAQEGIISLDDFFQEPPKVQPSPQPETSPRQDENQSARGGKNASDIKEPAGLDGTSPGPSREKVKKQGTPSVRLPKPRAPSPPSQGRPRSVQQRPQSGRDESSVSPEVQEERASSAKAKSPAGPEIQAGSSGEPALQEEHEASSQPAELTSPKAKKNDQEPPSPTAVSELEISGAEQSAEHTTVDDTENAQIPEVPKEPLLTVGTRVKALFDDDFWDGKVEKVNADETYKILFDDGDVMESVPRHNIKVQEGPPTAEEEESLETSEITSAPEAQEGIPCPPLVKIESPRTLEPIKEPPGKEEDMEPVIQVGVKVEALYDGDFYPGTVDKVNDDHTYKILFDDDDVLDSVPRKDIKIVASPKDSSVEASQDVDEESEYSDEEYDDEETEVSKQEVQAGDEEAVSSPSKEVDLNGPATKIQSAARGRIARNRVSGIKEEKQKTAAAVAIQSAARGRMAKNRVKDLKEEKKQEELKKEGAALKIQCSVRQRQARKEVEAKRAEKQEEQSQKEEDKPEEEPEEDSIEESYGDDDFDDSYEDDEEDEESTAPKSSRSSKSRTESNQVEARSSSTKDEMSDLVPVGTAAQDKTLEGYTIVRVLGEGAYGEVLLATQRSTNRQVALKKFKNGEGEPEEEADYMLRCQRREVALVQKLAHPNIVKAYTAFNTPHQVQYVVFESVPGTVLELIEASPSGMKADDTRTIFHQLLQALAFCHSHGVVHRDIKPENLLVQQDATELVLKLCDFGAARYMDAKKDPEDDGQLTHYVGSRWYRPPEVLASGTDYDTSVDIWASGVLLLEMASGRPPFQGDSETEVVENMVALLGTVPVEVVRSLQDGGVESNVIGRKMAPKRSFLQYTAVLGESGVELAARILKWKKAQRPSANECLKSPYITGQSEDLAVSLDGDTISSEMEISFSASNHEQSASAIGEEKEEGFVSENFDDTKSSVLIPENEADSVVLEEADEADKVLPDTLFEELGPSLAGPVKQWMRLADNQQGASGEDVEPGQVVADVSAALSMQDAKEIIVDQGWLRRFKDQSSRAQWAHLLLLIQGVVDAALEPRRLSCQRWMLSQQRADVTLIECMEHVQSEAGAAEGKELAASQASFEILSYAEKLSTEASSVRRKAEAKVYQNSTLNRWLALISTLLLDPDVDHEIKQQGLSKMEGVAGLSKGTLTATQLLRPWLMAPLSKALLLACRLGARGPEKRVALTTDREEVLERTLDLLENTGFLKPSDSAESALVLCPYYKSSFGSKVSEGFTVEEGEGLGPRKELFSLLSLQLTEPWRAVVPLKATSSLSAADQNDVLKATVSAGKEGTNKVVMNFSSGAASHLKEGNRISIKLSKTGVTLHSKIIKVMEDGKTMMLDSVLPEDLDDLDVEVSEPRKSVLCYQQDLEGHWLSVSADAEAHATRRGLRLLGSLLALTVSNQVTLDLQLPDLFFEAMLNPEYKPSLEEIRNVNPSLYNSMRQISKLNNEDFSDLMEAEGLSSSTLLDDYIRDSLYDTLIGSYKSQFELIQQGFFRVLPESDLKDLDVSAADINTMACGVPDSSDKDFDFRSIFQIVMDSDIEIGSPPLAQALWEVIEEFTPQMKRKLLVFITGVSKLPAPQTEFLTIEQPFVPLDSDDLKKMMDMLPQSHTCDNILELPNYWKALVKLQGQLDASGSLPVDEEMRLKSILKDTLKTKILLAVENSEGYGLDAIDNSGEERGVRSLLSRGGSRRGISRGSTKDLGDDLEESESMNIPALGDEEEESQSMNIPTLGGSESEASASLKIPSLEDEKSPTSSGMKKTDADEKHFHDDEDLMDMSMSAELLDDAQSKESSPQQTSQDEEDNDDEEETDYEDSYEDEFDDET